jgi:cation/acetate symporter
MAQITSEEALREREKLDIRIAYVSAAFVFAYAFVALLDRMGAPIAFVEGLSPYLTIVGLGVLGALLHSMRVSHYYAAGRAVPAEYAGFAIAALAAGMILPFAAEFASTPWLLGLPAGVFAGVALIAAFLGPTLRKTGAFSLSGLLATRFPSLAPRFGVIALACVCSELVALAGQQSAVDILTALLGGGRHVAALVVAVAVLLIAGPGGLRGAVWTACAAGAIGLAGFAWPVAVLAWRGAPPVAGTENSAWRETAAYLQEWGVATGRADFGAEVLTALAATLGIAILAPLLAPAIAVERPQSARAAGVAAFGWTWLFAWLIAATLGGATLSLARQSVGVTPERLPDAVYEASGHRLVDICGASAAAPVAAKRACLAKGHAPGAPLTASDIAPRGKFLLMGLPALERMGAAVSGFLAAAQIALALAFSAAGLQAFGTALGHEAVFRMRGATDLTSRRLATTRLALMLIASAGYLASAHNLFDDRGLLALALGLSAAAGAPVVALALWPRAGDRDALFALLGGLFGMTLTIFVAGSARDGAVIAGAALAGAALGLAAGVASAVTRPAGASPLAKAFVDSVLRGDGDVMGPEKGA